MSAITNFFNDTTKRWQGLSAKNKLRITLLVAIILLTLLILYIYHAQSQKPEEDSKRQISSSEKKYNPQSGREKLEKIKIFDKR